MAKAEYLNWLKTSPYRERRGFSLDQRESFRYLRENIKAEIDICKFFGCGKKLRSQEILCGNYCVHHQKKKIGLTQLIDKLIVAK
jgi:hypothetical protein